VIVVDTVFWSVGVPYNLSFWQNCWYQNPLFCFCTTYVWPKILI